MSVRSGRDERGSGTVLTGVIALCLVVATIGAVWVIGWVTSINRAARLADLAAISGAHAINAGRDGCDEAERVADEHGGRIADCTVKGSAPSFVLVIEVAMPLRPAHRLPGAPTLARGEAAAGPGER